mgnify:FL=1
MTYISIFAALAFACGIIAADIVPVPAAAGLAGAGFCLPAMWALRHRMRWALILLLCLMFSLGLFRLAWESRQYEALPAYLAGMEVYVEGTVKEKKHSYETEQGTMSRYVIDMDYFAFPDDPARHRGKGSIYVTLPASPVHPPSERLGLRLNLKELTYYGNPGLYDARHRDREQSIFLKGYTVPDTKIETLEPGRGILCQLWRLRQYLTHMYQTVLDRDNAYILSSLLFGGHYDDLPPSLLESFSITGLIHILSVSGSHISLLLAVVQILGRLASLREKPLFILSAVVVIVYGALAEGTAPVIRSSLMGLISAYSLTARRQYTACHALALAIIAMLLYSPYLLFDLSFQLSCGASAGIVLLQRPVERWFSFLPSFLRSGISVCICAQLLLIPFLLHYFSALPVYSLLANLLVAPVLDFVILLGLAASVLGMAVLPLGQVLLYVLQPLLSLAVKGNYFISSLPYSRFWQGAWPVYTSAAYYLVLTGLFFLPPYRKVLLRMAGILFLVSTLYAVYTRPEIMIYSYDMGNDRATCIVYDDTSACLWYNKSQWSHEGQIACALTPALRHCGIFHLDRVWVSGDAGPAEAQLRQDFTIGDLQIVTEPVEGDAAGLIQTGVPYYLYETSLPRQFPSGSVLEVQSLRQAGRTAFPRDADFLILHRSGPRDVQWKRWCETAALYDIPCVTPEEDGAVILSWRRGCWTVRSGGEWFETGKNHIWQ